MPAEDKMASQLADAAPGQPPHVIQQALATPETPLSLIVDCSIHSRRDNIGPPPPSLADRPSTSRTSRQPSSLGVAGDADASGLKRCLRRLLCGWSCIRGKKTLKIQLSSSLADQPGPSPLNSLAPGRRSNPSAAGRGGSAGPNINANSTACSSDSHVGPLPSRQLQFMHNSLDAGNSDGSAGAMTLMASPAMAALRAAAPCSSASNPSSIASWPTSGLPQVVCVTSAAGACIPLGGSRASSIASHTSGVTTTSRPSRWGILANILSAGLRSFTQLANVVEPGTGNLTVEAVHDLTRRASRLDVVRAVGQVRDLSLIGSGSVGLVYRGRMADGSGASACVKYLVARGADGMAAPATEGLLSRALVHPNIVVTFSWHVTRVTSDNFLDLSEALAATAARGSRKAAKQARRSAAVAAGKVRRGGIRHAPPAAARSRSTTLPQYEAHSGGDGSGGGGGTSCVGSIAHGPGGLVVRDTGTARKAGRIGSGTLTAHVLEMVRASAAAGTISRGRPASPNGSPLTRLGFSIHRSFTSVRSAGQGEGGVPLLPASSTADYHNRDISAPGARRRELSPAQAVQQQQQQQQQLADSQRTDFEGSWSVRRGEFYTNSDVGNRIVQQAAACDAAAAAAAAGAPSCMTTWFGRESLSGHWFSPSPNPSNHAPVGGSSHYSRRSGGGGVDGSHPNAGFVGVGGTSPVQMLQPSGTSCVGSLLGTGSGVVNPVAAAAAAAGAAVLPQPSAPVSIQGSAGRGRGTLVRVGSRLQFATMPSTQRSIPENVQALDIGNGSAVLQQGVLPVTQSVLGLRDERRKLLDGVAGSGDVALLPSPGTGAVRQPYMAPPAAAVAESVGSRGSGAAGGGADSTVMSTCTLRDSSAPQSPPRSDQGNPHRDVGTVRRPTSLLAVAIASQGLVQHGGHGFRPAHCHPTAGPVQEIRPAFMQSRTGSTVLTRTTTSSKRLSSTATVPNSVHTMASLPNAATGTVAGSVAESTPSGNGSGHVAASGSAYGAPTNTGGSSGDAAAMAAAAETDGDRQESLEQGWRTLQQIMQRLNARPGDYLTRIVMEDADQGSLLGAVRSGRFRMGADGGELRMLLLTSLDIARGMAFLHSHNVIHGDLKPSNVLLCSDPADPRGFVAKVSDFGLSRIITRDHDFVQNPDPFPAGTVSYMAPETVTGSSFKASDVWSYAVVTWQLVTGEVAPWPGLRNVQIIMGVMQDELRLSVPSSAYPPLGQLIESCLAHDHTLRPTFDDIVQKLQAMLRDIARAPPIQLVASPPAAITPSAATRAGTNTSTTQPRMVAAGPAGAFPLQVSGPHVVVVSTPTTAASTPASIASLATSDGGVPPDDRQLHSDSSEGRGRSVQHPGLTTMQSSLAGTSVSLATAAASSNQLTQMSSSWANMDQRSSAWHSSVWHNTGNVTGFGGGSSFNHSRQLVMSTGGSTSMGTLAAERQCLQELYGRPRTSTGTLAADEFYAIGRHSGTGTVGLSGPSGGSGLRGPAAGMGMSLAGVDVGQQQLPPVHEEQPGTSSSGCQTILTHGSGLSGGVAHLSNHERRLGGSSGVTGPVLYGCVEATLPGMLQAGLIVLGGREPAPGRSSSKSTGSQRPGSAASSLREEQRDEGV